MFTNALKNTINKVTNVTYTENGALAYKTTHNPFVDLNFKIAGYRSLFIKDPNLRKSAYTTKTDTLLIKEFANCFTRDPKIAMKYLFYIRDARGGLGERSIFRECLKYLISHYYSVFGKNFTKELIKLIPEYGRWDDVVDLYNFHNKEIKKIVVEILRIQLAEDYADSQNNKSISLLAKWMPSVQHASRKLALQLANDFGYTEKYYRKLLAGLRSYLDVTEVKMSSKDWPSIEYSTVPSKANILYRNAFLAHDKERRTKFLEDLQNNKTKINASVNTPFDVISAYTDYKALDYVDWRLKVKSYDQSLEEIWKALPNYIKDSDGNEILVVADTSSSMTVDDYLPYRVCMSLALYCSERLTGPYKDQIVVFSSCPRYIDMSGTRSLHDKMTDYISYSDYTNTNILATFDLILETAKINKLSQKQLPKTILVISDMEFDAATYNGNNERVFKVAHNRYKAAGYHLPRLVFWNVRSKTKSSIPMLKNKYGLTLVSGFSPSILRMVLSNKLDPYAALLDEINSPRYDLVDKLLSTHNYF